jgi:hypothetical protein
MALDTKLSTQAANAAADAIVDLLDGGTIQVYDGTVPATANTAITTQILLGTLTLGTPAFGSAVDGVATAEAILAEDDADATGTASFCRALTSGATVIFQGTVGTSGCNLNLSSTSIEAGGSITVTSATYTQPLTT